MLFEFQSCTINFHRKQNYGIGLSGFRNLFIYKRQEKIQFITKSQKLLNMILKRKNNYESLNIM